MKKSRIILIILAAALLSALTAFAVSSANDVMMTFDKGTDDEVANMPQTGALSTEYTVPDNVPEREGYKFLYWTLDYGAKTSYTVRYVLEGTDDDIVDPKVVPEVYAFTNVTEEAAAFDGYDFASDPEQSVVLDPDSGKNVFTFYYKKHVAPTSYTIVCYDDMGNDITPAFLTGPFDGMAGESVMVTAPGSEYEELEYYELSAESPYSDTRELSENEDENVFVFTYCPKTLTYCVRYVLYGTDEDIAEPETYSAAYKTVLTQRYKNIEGYNIRGSASKRVTINKDGIVVIFYYTELN